MVQITGRAIYYFVRRVDIQSTFENLANAVATRWSVSTFSGARKRIETRTLPLSFVSLFHLRHFRDK